MKWLVDDEPFGEEAEHEDFGTLKKVKITDDELELLKGLIRLHIKDGFNRAIDIDLLKKLESIG